MSFFLNLPSGAKRDTGRLQLAEKESRHSNANSNLDKIISKRLYLAQTQVKHIIKTARIFALQKIKKFANENTQEQVNILKYPGIVDILTRHVFINSVLKHESIWKMLVLLTRPKFFLVNRILVSLEAKESGDKSTKLDNMKFYQDSMLSTKRTTDALSKLVKNLSLFFKRHQEQKGQETEEEEPRPKNSNQSSTFLESLDAPMKSKGPKKQNRPGQRARRKQFEASTKEVPVPKPNPKPALHPSWEAKKKSAPSIVSFKGKKLILDSDL
jgi:hypothetical protein